MWILKLLGGFVLKRVPWITSWPVIALGAVLVLGGIGAYAYREGYKNATNQAAADQVEQIKRDAEARMAAVQAAVKEYRDRVEKSQTAASKTQTKLERQRAISRSQREEIRRYASTHTSRVKCLDADGVRIVNAALGGHPVSKPAEAGPDVHGKVPGEPAEANHGGRP